MDAPRVGLDELVHLDFRPSRPVRVTPNMHAGLVPLRQALIAAAAAGCTMTYGEASEASGRAYLPRGMGRMLDVVTEDCRRRDEPSLAALVVRKDEGEVGEAFIGNAGAERQACWTYWRAASR